MRKKILNYSVVMVFGVLPEDCEVVELVIECNSISSFCFKQLVMETYFSWQFVNLFEVFIKMLGWWFLFGVGLCQTRELCCWNCPEDGVYWRNQSIRQFQKRDRQPVIWRFVLEKRTDKELFRYKKTSFRSTNLCNNISRKILWIIHV